MVLSIPVAKIYRNFLLTKDNEVWAYFKVPLISITGQNREKQEKHKDTLNQFFQGLRRYKDIDISLEPVSFDLERRMEELSKDFSSQYNDLAENISERTIQILERELGLLTTERLIVGVKLSEVFSSETLKEKSMELMDQVVSRTLSLFRYQLEVDQSFFERFGMLEEMLFQRFGAVQGVRLTEQELMHHVHYPFVRGLKSALSNEPINFSDTYSLTDTIINPYENQGVLELSTREGKSYISILPIHKFSKNMRFNHVIERVQELPFPVEFQFKGRFEPLKGTNGLQGKSNRANKRLKNFARESQQTGDSEGKNGRLNRYILLDLDEKIEERVPIIKWQGAFVVYGSSVKQCRKRSAQLIDYCEALKVEVVNGLADQDKLFHYFLAGQKSNLIKNWVHYTTAEGIAEMMIGTNNRIGDQVGFPIGRVSTMSNVAGLKPEQIARACRKVVMFNPRLANQADIAGKASSSPHIAITGPTGGGKSFLAKLIFFYCSLLKGKGLYIDPKSEYKEWLMKVEQNPYYQKNYPLFIAYIRSFNYVTLNPDTPENHGVLDPMNYLSGANVQDTLETIFEQIYDFTDREDARTDMLRGIKQVVTDKSEGKKVGLMSVVDYMIHCENEETRKSGRAIYERVEGSILELAFSRGESEGLNLHSKITILEVAGLDMPTAKENPRNYTSSQRKSVALMMCLGKFCEQFGSERDENTFVLFDEAWIFSSSEGGRKIIKSMRRIGRSYNNMMVLITQSIHDTKTEDDSGNFGRIFAFDNSDEREDILRHIGLEVTDTNIDWLKKTPQYHCLYLDIYGRVNRMLVYCPFEEVLESLKTVNKNASGSAEEMFIS